MSKKFLSALLVGTALTISSAAHSASTDVFAGVDVAHNSWYTYVGGVTALQGQDIVTQPGFLARLAGGYGQYSYNKPGTGTIDGNVGNANLMLGYGNPFAGGHFAAYIGGDWINHRLSPSDPLNRASGSRGGVKGQLELNFSPADRFVGNLMGSYSTAFRTYWTHADVGYNFGSFAIGPEIGFNGNNAYNEVRYGAQINALDLGFADASIHGGYVSSNRSGARGAYGAVGFNRHF